MTAIEKIHTSLDKLADQIKKDAIEDILITLKESLASCDDSEITGLKAAIEIITTNY